ncbi:MAG: alpha/beta hydrolase [Candidatus Sumerlaeia bacterium]|nr:alpha/beta hydrolase [Candidatus Sumerlaeia bacterium]
MMGILGIVLILLGGMIVGCHTLAERESPRLKSFLPQQVASQIVPERLLSYRQSGEESGQRIIFVHGSPGDSSAWLSFLENPIEGAEVIAVDRLGYGRSITGTTDSGKMDRSVALSYADQAEALGGLLVERDGRWPILVGHSLGGPIVAEAAAQFPGKVEAIMILAGSLDPAYEEPRWYSRVFAPGVTRWILPRPWRNSNKEMMVSLAETTRLQTRLGLIECPVIVIHGEGDSLVPVGNVEYLRQNLPVHEGHEFLVIPKQGHFLPWEQEELIRERLARLSHKQ